MRFILMAAASCALLAACSGCESPHAPSAGITSLVVASWNAQALFDASDDGAEYAEYRSSSGWTEAKYRARQERVAEAVAAMSGGGPDVLVLVEIENAAVLESLASGTLAGFGYGWMSFAKNDGAALGLGVLSRYPITKTLAHGASLLGCEVPRPVLEARIDAGGAPLAVIACHWKSKLGGESETEASRRASAAVAARRIAELASAEPDLGVLVLGDLNENHDEFARRGGREAVALLPDTEDAAAVLEAEADRGASSVLVLSAARPPASERIPGGAAVFSPWPDSAWSGSYAYRGEWETIDHALANAALFDGRGWDYAYFAVADGTPLTDASGMPAAYRPFSGTGCSDHLPIVVVLERR